MVCTLAISVCILWKIYSNAYKSTLNSTNLIDDERLEAKYMGIGVGRLPLNTRLMYFDLLKIKVSEG